MDEKQMTRWVLRNCRFAQSPSRPPAFHPNMPKAKPWNPPQKKQLLPTSDIDKDADELTLRDNEWRPKSPKKEVRPLNIPYDYSQWTVPPMGPGSQGGKHKRSLPPLAPRSKPRPKQISTQPGRTNPAVPTQAPPAWQMAGSDWVAGNCRFAAIDPTSSDPMKPFNDKAIDLKKKEIANQTSELAKEKPTLTTTMESLKKKDVDTKKKELFVMQNEAKQEAKENQKELQQQPALGDEPIPV